MAERQTFFARLKDRVRQIWAVRCALRQGAFDVLVVKTAHDWATLARDLTLLLATAECRPCTVLQFHGSWPEHLLGESRRIFRLATHWLLRLCDGALVLSQEELRLWQAFSPCGRFLVVRNPFEPSTGAPLPRCRAAFGFPEDAKPLVLFVGRLVREKGINELLTAAEHLAGRCYVLLLGDGPLMTDLVARLKSRGMEDVVKLGGYVEVETLGAAYRAADIFVLPSWSEGFSFALMEAMNAALPIVTSPIRGMADHLESGVNALFAAPRDAKALVTALDRLINDEAMRRRMGEANRRKLAEFAPPLVAAEYLDALRSIEASLPSGARDSLS